MTEGFGPKIPGFDHFNFGDHKKLKKLISKNTAAIMIEPIMGEGGIKVIPTWCLKEIRKICNKKKILLILDQRTEHRTCPTGRLHEHRHLHTRWPL